ncbi:hypothetical protein HDU76_002521 [Blyttiomyces sp. JEL0837]|nr:hypothetical protein HDU76_002521 [Blyttiomyces sp. JEL0837]
MPFPGEGLDQQQLHPDLGLLTKQEDIDATQDENPSPPPLSIPISTSGSSSILQSAHLTKKIGVSPRRWSCELCRQRKKKCDGLRPKCGYCANRDLDCVYLGKLKPELEDHSSSSVPLLNKAGSKKTSTGSQQPQQPQQSQQQQAPSPVTTTSNTPFTTSSGSTPPLDTECNLTTLLSGDNEMEVRFLVDQADKYRSLLPLYVIHRRTLLKSFKTFQPLLKLSLCTLGALLTARFYHPHLTKRPALEYYNRARKEAMDCIDHPSLENMQALLTLFECSMLCGKLSGGYMLLGMATRMAMLLQLHVDPDELERINGEKIPWVTKEIRRRCWHACCAMDSVLSTTFTRFPHLIQSNVKPLCSDELWESLVEPSKLEFEFYNPTPGSGSCFNSYCHFAIIFRKVFTTVFRTTNPAGANILTPATFTAEETARISAIQEEAYVAYTQIPNSGRFALDVAKFTRGAAAYLIESQSPIAKEFKSWLVVALNSQDRRERLPWPDLVVGKEALIYDVLGVGGGSMSSGTTATTTITTSPEEWFFENWNRSDGPPWKALMVQLMYHNCIIFLQNRRLFGFVELLAGMESGVGTDTYTGWDSVKMESFQMAFQQCRLSAEYISIMVLSVLEATSATGVKNMFPGFMMQSLFHSALILIMLISTRSHRFFADPLVPFAMWDSGVDEEAAMKYFAWLDMSVEVLGDNMIMDNTAAMLVRELEVLVKRVRKGENVKLAILACSKAGVSAEVTVAAAAAVLEEQLSLEKGGGEGDDDGAIAGAGGAGAQDVGLDEQDPVIAELSEGFKSSMVLEMFMDMKKHTNAIAEVVQRSAVASVRSASNAASSPALPIAMQHDGRGVQFDGSMGAGRVAEQPMVTDQSHYDLFTRRIVLDTAEMVAAVRAHQGAVVGIGGNAHPHFHNAATGFGNVEYMNMAGMEMIDEAGLGLSNVATRVQEFLDILSMDWTDGVGAGGGTGGEDIQFEGMMFDTS